MFRRGRRPWRGARGVHRWVRSEQEEQPQHFQPDEADNQEISQQHEFQELSGENFSTGRGGKKRDFRTQNGPDYSAGNPHFVKKPKNSFINSNNFTNNSGDFKRNPPSHNVHQNHHQQNMRPNHPPQDLHQNHPGQIRQYDNHPPQNMHPNRPPHNVHPNRPPQRNHFPQSHNHPPQTSHPGHPSQHVHHNPPMHSSDYGDEPAPDEGAADFPPSQQPMDNVPFRCTMCGKPFKKKALLDIHLETECKAAMNQGQPSHFQSDNFQRGNNYRGRPRGLRRRGQGRRGGFNHNFNPPHENDHDFNDVENFESWDEFENNEFHEAQDNFGNDEFSEQNAFRGSRGRGRGRSRGRGRGRSRGRSRGPGLLRPPYRGGQMGPRPPFHSEFQDSEDPHNNLQHEAYTSDVYNEDSNSYDGPPDDGYSFHNQNHRMNNRRGGSRNFFNSKYCNLCNVQVSSFEELQFHKEKFHLKCKFCVAFFATKPDLYLHQETHLTEENSNPTVDQNIEEPFIEDPNMQHDGFPSNCHLCGQIFNDHESLSTHLQNDHGQLPLPPMFPLPETVEGQEGMSLNEPESATGAVDPVENISEQIISYPCCLCITSYSNTGELSEHISSTHPPALVCSECGFVFKDEEQLQGHRKYEHSQYDFPEKERYAILAHTDYYPCELCSEVQCSPATLQFHMHVHRVHNVQHEPKSNRQPYIACPECNVLIKSNGLKNHILNNHKLITCNVCQQVFSDKYVFVKHVDLEHYPNCVCNICCAICFNNNALQQHGATEHAMGEMFKCNLCSKRFGMRTLLSIHELLHSELFSQCKVCGEFFKMPEYMLEFRSHMVDTHGMDSGMFV